ncbi:CPBP family intramembrane glutamic endopeptidase [Erythrobacter sp.]|jgi:membrane protease YdiL (CAAX protease family)|uniref:CPBP family intramembrane glutamic endopeptidase n=1 Tax=Erythrobacter sp. TaxID=1042 RepID=UPI002EA8A306|nr:CPBP family intramembrane glutamic endopeptidase [Erythrobacter sp.]
MPTSPDDATAARPIAPNADAPDTNAPDTGALTDPSPGGEAAGGMIAEWRRLWAFIKRPSLAVRHEGGVPLTALARLYALDVAIMLVLILAATIAVALGVYLPATALAGIEFTPTIVFLVVVAAPLFEEIVFRGWLSGRPGVLLALLALALGLGGAAFAHMMNPLLGVGLALAGLVGAVAALVRFRDAEPLAWFERLFPAFFWLSTVAFALVHIANFEEGTLAILLPLVLPQFILGMILAYVRVRFALWAAILLHAVHNATALTFAALAMLAES